MEKFLKKHYRWFVLIIMTFFVTVTLLNAKNDSATFDEVAHIPAAYSYVTKQDTRLNPEHPPLLKDFVGLPLAFFGLNFDTTKNFWTGEGLDRVWDDGQWVAGKHLLYEAGNNPDQILFWARLPIIIISVLLGLFLFMWGKKLAGTLGGLFALTLYAFDPNILGHNHYVTTDVGIAAFLTFAFYFFLKFIKYPTWKNVLWAGFFLGLVNLAKFSSLMAYPILALVILSYPLIKKISHDEKVNSDLKLRAKTFFSYIGKGVAILTISMIVVWIGYYFNTQKMPQEIINRQINFSFPLYDTNPLSQLTNKSLSFLNSKEILKPYAEYFLGVTMVFKRVAGGNGTYFLQNVSGKASPVYFPFVFIVKETIPFLALIFLSIGICIAQISRNIHKAKNFKDIAKKIKLFLQTKVTEYTLLSFVLLYSFLSITGNLNIGFRHLFPILPCLYILITKKLFDYFRKRHVVTKHQLMILASVVIAWIVLIPLVSYPNYISYFNESIGGSSNGYKYVTDSNTDWGQDLKRLTIWIEQHNKKANFINCQAKYGQIFAACEKIDQIRVDYFGGGNPEYYLKNQYISWWDSKRPVEKGWYAISANSLQISLYNKEKSPENNYAWTKHYMPADMIGNSILIYYIDIPPAE